MSQQVPVLRNCAHCRGTGERGKLPCLACKGAGLVWVDAPDSDESDADQPGPDYPDADRLPPQRPASES